MGTLARRVIVAALLAIAFAPSAGAVGYVDHPPPLIDRLTPEVLAVVFPGAGRLEATPGPPSAVAVYDGDTLAGYIFSTLDIVRARGFVYTPFDVIVGVDLGGHITGVREVFNRESYIYGNVNRTALLATFLSTLTGLRYNGLVEGPRGPDFVTGATISARSMRSAVADSARAVIRTYVGLPVVTVPTLDMENYTPMTAAELIADGSIRTLKLTNGQVADALVAAGAAADARPRHSAPRRPRRSLHRAQGRPRHAADDRAEPHHSASGLRSPLDRLSRRNPGDPGCF